MFVDRGSDDGVDFGMKRRATRGLQAGESFGSGIAMKFSPLNSCGAVTDQMDGQVRKISGRRVSFQRAARSEEDPVRLIGNLRQSFQDNFQSDAGRVA